MYFSGRVNHIVFSNDAESFYILRMVMDEEEGTTLDAFGFDLGAPATVRGNVPGMVLEIGSWFGFEGKWVTHEQYGRQIQIERAPVIKGNWTPEIARNLLVSHGVGARVAGNIQRFHGDSMVPVLDAGDVEALMEVPAITEFTAEHVLQRWRTITAYFRTLDFLSEVGVPKSRIRHVWEWFGDEAETVLAKDPWSLVQVDGISFKQADEVALKLGLSTEDPRRLTGAALYAAKSHKGMGHMYLSSMEMLAAIRGVVSGATAKGATKALVACHQKGSLILDRQTRPGTTAIYEPWLYRVEKECAALLAHRVREACFDRNQKLQDAFLDGMERVGPAAEDAVKSPEGDLDTVAEAALKDWSAGAKLSLSGEQLKGCLNALVEPVSILTGLPGTGKTTALRAVVRVLLDAETPFLLVAPTGIAAKRLKSVTGAEASTIHRAFGAKGWDKGNSRKSSYKGVTGKSKGLDGSDGSDEEWEFAEGNYHPAEVVIVDEASMVDQHLLYRLLSCTAPTCRLVLVGDAAQLPSVGPGNVLRDMVNSKMFPTVSLTQIFRQADTSAIIAAAHAVHAGNIPETSDEKGAEFMFLRRDSEEEVLRVVCNLAQRLYTRRHNFQVLSPRHAGTLGVTNLNERLRTLLNPKQPALQEMRLGSDTIRVGDRIMVVKNNYNFGIFNGDVGKVARIDRRDKVVEIKIHGPPVMLVKIPFKEAPGLLRLAYAVTVHKCVHPDTLVETPEGLLPIRDIDDTGRIATPGGERPYRNKVVNPERPAVRITTRGGYTLTATPDHGIDVWDGERYVRREAGELTKGDLLRLRLGVTSEPSTPSTLPEAPRHDVRAHVHKIPTRMDEDMAEFLGLMVADGTVYQRGFRLAKRHEDTVARFVELCRHLFDVRVRRYYTNGAHHAEVNSTFLSAWLSSIGGLDPHRKAVPNCVLRSPSRLQARFLRGLFADGSVHTKHGCLDHIEWTCKFDGLPAIVRTMLLRFGIPCGTTPNRGIHTVYIYGNYAKLFGLAVGFPSAAKQERLLLPCGDQTRYFVPVSRDEARALRENHLDVLGHSTCGNVAQRGRLSLHKLLLLVRAGVRSPTVVGLLARGSGYHHEPVVSVATTTCPSVCVEVPNGHQFLQNGFSAWNCQGLEYDMIVMPLVTSFYHQLQRNLFYTAITRARSRVFLVGHRDALIKSVINNRPDARNTLFMERLGLVSLRQLRAEGA